MKTPAPSMGYRQTFYMKGQTQSIKLPPIVNEEPEHVASGEALGARSKKHQSMSGIGDHLWILVSASRKRQVPGKLDCPCESRVTTTEQTHDFIKGDICC